ncbi:hypothetical protein [Streptomyces sp. NBC_00233]|uniref:hypothetical protein n=1 Tax=Streptomyces sp. NBC_00233 TaxID=2975686 RepID=UPI002256DDA3|nr:hypothetical protein [Streptomyces sp. NBC_00233]MCX5231329.1 hypothetical protein [Streptomyces sp. NBC_00233]
MAFEALVKLIGEERCSKEFREIIQKIRVNTIDDEVRNFAEARSPKSFLSAYNDASTPILMTTTWYETIFSVAAVIDFHNRLTAHKALLVQVGDHGNAELPGLNGLSAKPTDMAYRWLDHHLGYAAGDGNSPRFDVRSEYMLNPLTNVRHPPGPTMPCRRSGSTSPTRPPGRTTGSWSRAQRRGGWTHSVKATGKAPTSSSPPSSSRPAWPNAWACSIPTRPPTSTAASQPYSPPRLWNSPRAYEATWNCG